MPQRRLIFNADDFGYSKGVNEGIIESHVKGIVTSTSVMVLRKFAYEASSLKKIPNRDASVAKFRIDFFGKSAFGYDKTEKVSSEALIKLIKKLPRGTYEIVCHPAKDPMNDLSLRSTNTGYLHQRALELKTLTDPSVIEFIENEGSISLINWKDVPAAIV